MKVAEWAIFPALLIMALRAFFTAIGRAQIILWATLAGTLLNVLLGYAFIFGHFGAPALGIRGAAVGALGTNTLTFVVLAAMAARAAAYRRYGLFVRLWRPDWSAFRDVVRLGFPVAMTIIAEVGLFMMSSLMMGWLGTVALAAHGIALQLASIAFMIPLGLSQVGTVRVGQAHGRGDLAGLDRAAKAVMVVGLAVSLTGAMLFWLIPERLIGLFLDTSNPLSEEVVRFAVPLLAVAAAFQLADCLQVLGSGLLRGLARHACADAACRLQLLDRRPAGRISSRLRRRFRRRRRMVGAGLRARLRRYPRQLALPAPGSPRAGLSQPKRRS